MNLNCGNCEVEKNSYKEVFLIKSRPESQQRTVMRSLNNAVYVARCRSNWISIRYICTLASFRVARGTLGTQRVREGWKCWRVTDTFSFQSPSVLSCRTCRPKHSEDHRERLCIVIFLNFLLVVWVTFKRRTGNLENYLHCQVKTLKGYARVTFFPMQMLCVCNTHPSEKMT